MCLCLGSLFIIDPFSFLRSAPLPEVWCCVSSLVAFLTLELEMAEIIIRGRHQDHKNHVHIFLLRSMPYRSVFHFFSLYYTFLKSWYKYFQNLLNLRSKARLKLPKIDRKTWEHKIILDLHTLLKKHLSLSVLNLIHY